MPAIKVFIFNKLLAIFVFLIVKIVIREQYLVKPVICMCFRFFVYKNCNKKAAANVPVAKTFLSNIFFTVFAFLIAKIVIWGQQVIKLVIHTCFCFLPYKNCNAQKIRYKSLYSLNYHFFNSKC